MLFMNVWKVAGALQSPKVMTVGWNSPRDVLKAALYSSPSRIRILLYPQRISSLVKYLAPHNLSMSSGIRGRGGIFYGFCIECAVVHDWTELVILLIDEEERASYR